MLPGGTPQNCMIYSSTFFLCCIYLPYNADPAQPITTADGELDRGLSVDRLDRSSSGMDMQ